MEQKQILLTETVAKGGCAAKLPAGQLRNVLGSLKLKNPPELAVGLENLDDACLWDLGDGRFLIQTLDFFTPIVDDPFDFGRIAAANALSDVYAMGGTPKIALTILAFPGSTLPLTLLEPLMAGALDRISAAGACLAGGHSIDDDTLKFGFSVTGFVAKDKAWTNANAQVGDVLILTKGLGTGTITSALKNKKAEKTWVDAAITSMCALNDVRPLLDKIDVHSATDVTGFGLAGHATQMARASKKQFEIQTSQLPHLPGAMECLSQKFLNRAHRTNAEYVTQSAHYEQVDEAHRWLTVDPQTSGGLLLAVPASQGQLTVEQLSRKFPMTSMIGEVRPQADTCAVRFTN